MKRKSDLEILWPIKKTNREEKEKNEEERKKYRSNERHKERKNEIKK